MCHCEYQALMEKLDLILEKLKELADDPKALAALAERVKAADEKLAEAVKENKT
jgi:CHASE3 domain sensor protein